MSYILEALRRSQAEREQVRAPTLDLAAPAAEPSGPSPNRWGVLAAVLAGVAVLIAVYAAVRPTAGPDPAPRIAARPEAAKTAAPAVPASAEPALPVADSHAAPPTAPPAARPLRRPHGAPPAAPLVEAPPSKGPAFQTPSVVPEPVVARGAPAQPPPAPEVLDAAGGLTPEGAVTPEDAAAAALEEELARRAAQESDALPPAAVESSPPPVVAGPTPVPPDLIASIDAFKQEVRGGRGRDPGRDPGRDSGREKVRSREKGKDKDTQMRVAAQQSAPGVIAPQQIPLAKPEQPEQPEQPDQDPTRLRLTPEQEAALPKFRLTVHVFDADPSQRFVLINGLKYGEGSKTREGLTVETILQQGAVLSYQGSSFFVHR